MTPGSSVSVAMPMRPQNRMCGKDPRAAWVRTIRISASVKPCLVASWLICCSSSTETVRAFSTPQRSILTSSRSVSTLSTRVAYGSTSFSLLVCRWPMKCHCTSEGICGTLAAISCGRLSAKSRCPASYASCSFSSGWNLETATRRVPDGSFDLIFSRFSAIII